MRSYSDNTLFGNILKLISGEAVGRAIGFMAAPVITRLYTPSDFGILAVFTSLCALCYPFGTLKYNLAIPLHSNEKIGINSLAACIMILTINTAIIVLVLGFFHSPVLSFFSSESIAAFWYFIPLTLFFGGMSEILSYYSTRYRDFSTIAKVTVVQKAVGALTKIVLGVLRFNVIGLLIGNILAGSGGLALYIHTYWKRLKASARNVTWGGYGSYLKDIWISHYTGFRHKYLPMQRKTFPFYILRGISAPIRPARSVWQ